MANEMKQWLFRPFEKIAGTKALLAGLAALAVTGITGYFARINFDGILDAHFLLEDRLSLVSHMAEGVVNWLILSLVLLIAGLLLSRTKFRIIDIFGTQALARWPVIITALVALILPMEKMSKKLTDYFLWKLGKGEEVIPGTVDFILLGLFGLLSLAVAIWMVVLMYRAYHISFHIKGTKGVVSFIVALLIAEVLSKIALPYVYQFFG